MKIIQVSILALFQISCKLSLVSFPSSGKSAIQFHSNEKKEEKEKVLSDKAINDWLKEEFKNIVNNPYPI